MKKYKVRAKDISQLWFYVYADSENDAWIEVANRLTFQDPKKNWYDKDIWEVREDANSDIDTNNLSS